MASINDIRNHIGTVSQTRQITKAMHMISSSKMQKSMQRFEANTRYFFQVRKTMKDILNHHEAVRHPYLNQPGGERSLYIVIAADKGLAGAYNHAVLSAATEHMRGKQANIFTVGQMAKGWFEQQGMMVDVDFPQVMRAPTMDGARLIAETVLELYDQDLMDQVFIVYTQMVSPLQSKPHVLRLLPVREEDFEDVELLHRESFEMQYEPSAGAIMDLLIPQYLIAIIYGAILLSFASEHSARMNAMDAATRNADELLASLRIDLNSARQSAITNELAEIISGAEALEE